MKLVLMEIEPEHLSLLCDQLQAQSKEMNEIIENKDLSKPNNELLSAPYRTEITQITQARFQGYLTQSQRSHAEVQAFLLSKSLK